MAQDEWVRTMIAGLRLKLFDPASDDESSLIIQKSFDRTIRDGMADHFLREVRRIADSKNRLLACRDWIVKESRAYAPIRALFATQSSYNLEVIAGLRHPYQLGLWEDRHAIVEKVFASSLRKHGSVDTALDELRKESLWRNTRLGFATSGAWALEDCDPPDQRSWNCRYLDYLVADAELDIRSSLHLPVSYDVNALKSEIAAFEQAILSGQADLQRFTHFASGATAPRQE